jgi:hypothetical protein
LRRLLSVFLLSALAAACPARADWINLTGSESAPNIAEIYVLDDHVKVVLEVYVGDLLVFERLLPAELLRDAGVTRRSDAERLRLFSTEDFQVVTETGKKLRAELELIEPRVRIDRRGPFKFMKNPLTGAPLSQPPDDPRVLYVELLYHFDGRPPGELVFVPPLDADGMPRVTMGFIAYHKNVPITDYRYLVAGERLLLDWDDPWYSTFENPALKRKHKTGLMGFLYIEPYEVRHEILVRVREMENWIDLGLRGDGYIEVDELAPVKQKIGEFLTTRNPVLIDGESVDPILDRMEYVTVSLQGIKFLQGQERVEIPGAIVGVILTYLTDGIPQNVTVDWDMFTDQIQQVPVNAIDPAGPFPGFVTPEYPVHEWVNYLKTYRIPTVTEVSVADTLAVGSIPILSVLCLVGLVSVGWQFAKARASGGPTRALIAAACALVVAGAALYPVARVPVGRPGSLAARIAPEERAVILESLLRNVYRAFDFREEEDVYDKLSASVSGDLLADVYLQNRQSFEVQRAGGAKAKVKDVEIVKLDVTDHPERRGALAFESTWTAFGTVGHWGHIHGRKNQYDAVLAVEPVGGAWKITGLDLIEESRIDLYAQPAPPDSAAGRVTVPEIRATGSGGAP